jgi:hypothetical protein
LESYVVESHVVKSHVVKSDWTVIQWTVVRGGLISRLLIPLLLASLLLACGSGGVDQQAPDDPVAQTFPVAYIKRTLPVNAEGERVGDNLKALSTFNPGARLFVRRSASVSGVEINVTDRVFESGAQYDVKDVDVSYDGKKLVFAMRAPAIEDADEADQPTWNIWEYDIPTDTLTRVIESDITAEAGHDIAPHYLPIGDIIFSSTRQRLSKAILLDESKPQFEALDEDRRESAFLLHVIDELATIRQVTFNMSHDTDPTVTSDGKVVFTRWDNSGGRDTMNLYKMNPDGTELHLLYGWHSHQTGTDGAAVQFDHPREMADGRLMVLMRANESVHFGGDLVAIDVARFMDHETPLASELGGVSATAQESLTIQSIATDDSISAAGRYSTAFPLRDGSERMIVGWTQCRVRIIEDDVERIVGCTDERLAQDSATEASPLYVLTIYDPIQQTEKPIVVPEEGMAYTEVVALQAVTPPPIVHDKTAGVGLNADLLTDNAALLHIQSVYDLAGRFDDWVGGESGATTLAQMMDPTVISVDRRPARFLRIVKGVALPNPDVDDLPQVPGNVLGADRQQMREIVGYTTIQPDGSVKVKVPANVPLMISVLDNKGRRLGGRHKQWLTLRAGEERVCRGCHTAQSLAPHGRVEAEPDSINVGALTDGYTYPNTNPSIFGDLGETMAEALTRLSPELLNPSMDVMFEDVWNDPSLQADASSITMTYALIDYDSLSSSPPTTTACLASWSSVCRTVINYEEHIHPLWEKERITRDPMDDTLVLSNYTCTACHHLSKVNVTDPANAEQVALLEQMPVDCRNDDRLAQTMLLSQLNLTAEDPTSIDQRYASFVELRAGDNELMYEGATLVDRLVLIVDSEGNPVFERDEEGALILDSEGNPIQQTQTVPVSAATNAGVGARRSTAFFSMFERTGCHPGWLSDAELRVISEWLDLGGQYYNNPFDVPQN